MAKEETGYPSVNIFDEFLTDTVNFASGNFDDWCYANLGIPAYTIEQWDLGLRAGVHMWPRKDKDEAEQEEDFRKVLAWIDNEQEGEGFVAWQVFDHPQLGKVEIGGFDSKFLMQNAPPRLLLQECQKTARFFYRHVKTLPRLEITAPKVEQIDSKTWRVSLDLVNLSYLSSTLTQHAREIKVSKPITLQLSGAEVVDGLAKREVAYLEGRAAISGSFHPGGYRGDVLKPQKAHFSWIVQGETGSSITIKVQSQKAGNPEIELKLM
jgi:hypothetical protein